MSDISIQSLADLLKVDSNQLLNDARKLIEIKVDHVDQVLTSAQCKQLLDYVKKNTVSGQSNQSQGIQKLSVKKKKTLTLKSSSSKKSSVSKETFSSGEVIVKKRTRSWVVPEEHSQEEQTTEIQSPFMEASQAVEEVKSDTDLLEKEKTDELVKVKKEPSTQPKTTSEKFKKTQTKTNDDVKLGRQPSRSRRTKLREESTRESLAKKRKPRTQLKALDHGFEKPAVKIVRQVSIPKIITVAELAAGMSVKAAEVIKVMMKMGVMATINQSIDQDTALLVVEEMGHKAKPLLDDHIESSLVGEMSSQSGAKVASRAPVVTIMGHVDHGKTTLLDHIRKTRVTSGEAGGITQHIGAYHVVTPKGMITFLDTPGHEAFTAMRVRGVKCTDIVVLIVAADDGIKPQTIEAIQHAKAAEVPIVLAVNKVDLPNADPQRVKSQIIQHGLLTEDHGGDVISAEISAKTGQGVEALLESILLQAEMAELKSIVDGPARGVVIESRLDKGRGPVSTVLVQSGQLEKGNIMLAGPEYGRIRAMINSEKQSVQKAGPSMPVEVVGLSGLPKAGDEFLIVSSDRKAKEVADFRREKHRENRLLEQRSRQSDNFLSQSGTDNYLLPIVLKADVQGSLEAIRESLSKLGTEQVKVNVIASQVGGINESDINLALASKAMLIGFNVRPNNMARRFLSKEKEEVTVKYYSIIYELIEDVESVLKGLAPKEKQDVLIGLAEVREVFRSSEFGGVAGSVVLEGFIRRNCPIRVLRDNVIIYEGKLASLRRFKEDVEEVREGMECGIGVKGYRDIKVGDQIENYSSKEEAS